MSNTSPVAFIPYKALIIVPRQSEVRKSVFTDPFTVMLVTYYAPGCFRLD